VAGPLSKYSFINAKLRARLSKILPDKTFAQLAKAPGLDEALALLRDTPFAELEKIYSSTGDLKQAELELLREEIGLYKNIKQYIHEDLVELIDALLCRFEIDNLKNAIRFFFERAIRKHPLGPGAHYILHERIIHDIPVDIILNADSFDEVAGVCEGTPYRQIISKYSHTVESKGSLFRMEVAFDHFYYSNLLECINKLGKRDRITAVRLIGVEIDLQNIDWIIRLKNFYDLDLDTVLATIVPGGFSVNKGVIEELYRAQNVESVLDGFVRSRYPALSALLSGQSADSTSRLILIRRMLGEITRHEVRRILSGYPFTVGIILAYFILKQDELRKIRMILNAKQYGVGHERIESLI